MIVVRKVGRPAIHDLPGAPARTVDLASEGVDWRKAAVSVLKLLTTSLAGVSFFVCRRKCKLDATLVPGSMERG